MEQQRVFLAIALSIGVLIVAQTIFAPDPPPPGAEDKGAPTDAKGPDGVPSNPSVANPSNPAGAEPDKADPAAPKKDIPARDDIVLKDTHYKATFTNRGGRLRGVKITKPEQYTSRGDLIEPGPPEDEDAAPVGDTWLKYLPFGIEAQGSLPYLTEETVFEVAEQTEKTVLFRHEVPGVYKLEKRFSLDATHPSGFKVEIILTNLSKLQINDKLGLVLYAHQPEGSGEWSLFNPIPDTTEALCYTDGDMERALLDDAEEGMPLTTSSKWGGVSTRYFLMAAISKEVPFSGCDISLVEKRFFRNSLGLGKVSLSPGQSRTWTVDTFIGPKLIEEMDPYEANLNESIDYGIFAFLCRPIRFVLVWFYGHVGNWGLAIILLTFMLRLLTFPINHYAYKNMEGMRHIQEPMKALQEKYKDDPMKMQQEVMKLYKNAGVSPLGCLPQFLQIPIFFALYRTIYSSAELYHAEFYGWYTDLSAADPYFVLPVLVGLVMIGQQFLMPTTGTNPQMKYIMWAMPVMFAAFTFVLPAALGLYLVVSIGLGITQQFYIRKSLSKDKQPAAA